MCVVFSSMLKFMTSITIFQLNININNLVKITYFFLVNESLPVGLTDQYGHTYDNQLASFFISASIHYMRLFIPITAYFVSI